MTFTFQFEYSVEAGNLYEAKQAVLKELMNGYSFSDSVADVYNEDHQYLATVDFEKVVIAE